MNRNFVKIAAAWLAVVFASAVLAIYGINEADKVFHLRDKLFAGK